MTKILSHAWRRGGRLAARGARAAADDAGDRISRQQVPWRRIGPSARVRQGLASRLSFSRALRCLGSPL